MSGRKRPYIPPWQIEIETQDKEIRKLQSRLQDEQAMNRYFSEELSRMNKKIQATGEHLEQQHTKILKLDKDINELKQRDNNSREYAEQWLKLIREQQQALVDLAMDRFFKKKYRAYTEHIENIAGDINKKQYQASIALAQNWHTTMKNDMEEIKRHFQEGTVLEIELEDSFKQLTEMMNQKIIERKFDSDHGQVTEPIDISYWAHDEWKRVTIAFNQLRNKTAQLGNMDLAEMQDIEVCINEIVNLINTAGRKAEIRFLNYLRKMQMQENIAMKMIDRGFEIKDNIFEGDDMRSKNILLMENERGEKIIINIGETDDQLDMEVNFSTMNPHTHSQRLEGIMEAIGAKQVQTVPGYENKPAEMELFDMKTYSRTQKP